MTLSCSQRMSAHRMLREVRKALDYIDKPKKKRIPFNKRGEGKFLKIDNTGDYAQYAVYVCPETRTVRLVVYYEEELFDYALAMLSEKVTIEQDKTELRHKKNGWQTIISRPATHK